MPGGLLNPDDALRRAVDRWTDADARRAAVVIDMYTRRPEEQDDAAAFGDECFWMQTTFRCFWVMCFLSLYFS